LYLKEVWQAKQAALLVMLGWVVGIWLAMLLVVAGRTVDFGKLCCWIWQAVLLVLTSVLGYSSLCCWFWQSVLLVIAGVCCCFWAGSAVV
jgi:hypothetical protein